MSSDTKHGWAVSGILAACLIWAGSFAAMKLVLIADMSVGAMLTIRFVLGTLVLAGLVAIKRIPLQRRAILDGICLGIPLLAVYWLQADGLRFTTTSKSGFITGLYVIFTPLVSLLLGYRFKVAHALGALVAVLGLFLLVRDPRAPLGGWNRGDFETLLCAVACGFHIVLTGKFARRSNGWLLALFQVGTVAAASALLTPFVSSGAQPDGSRLGGFQGTLVILAQSRVWISIAYQSVLATALAFYLMATLQAYLGATEAAILYTLEPVFTALLAMSGLVAGIQERLSAVQLGGGAIIVGAMFLAEVGPRLLRSRLSNGDAIG